MGLRHEVNNVRYLTVFHYYCVRIILGILISRNIFHSIVSVGSVATSESGDL